MNSITVALVVTALLVSLSILKMVTGTGTDTKQVFKDTPETPGPVVLPVIGQLPSWMNGTLFRVGPAKFNIKRKDGSYLHIRHAFDGMPYMHRFVFSATKNQITYNSRNLSQEVERKLGEDPNFHTLFFGHTDPAINIFVKLYRAYKRLRTMSMNMDGRKPSDAMIGVTPTPNFPLGKEHFNDVHKVGDQVLVSKTDANMLQLLDAESLEPKKLFSYSTLIPNVQGQISAAHHQSCPFTKELFNIVMSMGRTTSIKVISLDSNGHGTLYGEVTRRLHDGTPIKAPYVHSFPLTQNYVVIPEYPLFFSGNGIPLMLEGTIEAAFEWDPMAKTYFHIISRETKEHIATIEADPAFSFHMGNSWEDEEGVHFECGVFPNGNITQQLHAFGNPLRRTQAQAQATRDANLESQNIKGIRKPSVRQDSFGNLRRYSISLDAIKRGTGQATYKDIAPNVEFPRFNNKLTGTPSRYVWGCSLGAATAENNETYSIVKVDTTTGETVRYYRPRYACSEPIFVPKPGATAEDEGIIVALANEFHESDESLDKCYIVALDGQTLEEFGKAEIGGFTPVTFHGSFVDKDFRDVSVN